MGSGYTLRCRKCGFEISGNLGIGYLFPVDYNKTMEAARAGESGETVRQFLEEHPDGVLNADQVFLRCTGCGRLEHGTDLSMYIRKPRASDIKAADVTPWSLRKGSAYQFYGLGNTCRECGKPMKPISDDDLEKQMSRDPGGEGRTEESCPVCKEMLWSESLYLWD